MSRVAMFAATVFAISSAGAVAQTAPISRTIDLTYTGVVSSTAADTILVRQPDGTLATYKGPLPDYPYKAGDPVTISFKATVPTQAYYDSAAYQGQKAADGIYRITVSSPYYNGGTAPGGVGNSSIADATGPIDPALNLGQPTNTRMTIVYDYNKDAYYIDGSGDFNSGAYGGVMGLIYNALTAAYEVCNTETTCRTSASSDPVLFRLSQNDDGTMTTGNVRIMSTDPASGTGTGVFSLLFSGSWNLPSFNGGAVQVPEPGMLGMFGLASMALVWRRRRARQGEARAKDQAS
ncbi:PEP-CTERM sorting domain-containing protein [Novosphingobium sp. TH158]|uniref:PEP-CTERM sorting domain-containing protein n=1 Tax=Novosphingobium sp. TH158 TaxID=2067455 RepID=UPI001181AE3C|nr:PEP-CTERM sorting domain-containing protein [Novosphingobium sp. TH158]